MDTFQEKKIHTRDELRYLASLFHVKQQAALKQRGETVDQCSAEIGLGTKRDLTITIVPAYYMERWKTSAI